MRQRKTAGGCASRMFSVLIMIFHHRHNDNHPGVGPAWPQPAYGVGAAEMADVSNDKFLCF